MSKEAHAPSPEVSKVLKLLEGQPDKTAVRLDFSGAHRMTSGDIVALADFMAQRPGLQEIQLKGHFHRVDYIHKTLLVSSRQNLRRLLLTLNTNRALLPLVLTRETTETLVSDFRTKLFPKLSTLGLYRVAFSSPDLVGLCIAGLSGLELGSLHLSLLGQPGRGLTAEAARAAGEALGQLRTLHRAALLNVPAGQAEAAALLAPLDRLGPHPARLSSLCLELVSPGPGPVDPSDLAVSFLAGVERRVGGDHSGLLETGVGILFTFRGFKKMVLNSVEELKRRVGALIVSLCSESVTAKKPRSRRAIRTLMDDVVRCVNICFEADGPAKEVADSLTRRMRGVVEDVRGEVEAELLKGLRVELEGEGTDSYGDSDGHGSKSKSGNTLGGSSTRGKRKRRDRDDWVFGSFCSSSPISDDLEEEADESEFPSNPQSDATLLGSARTGLGGRPVFSSTGTLWEYNPSSLALGSVLSFVAHCEQNEAAFERTSSRSPDVFTDEKTLLRRVELYEDIVGGEGEELGEEEQVALFEAVQPTIIDLYKRRSSMFYARHFSSLSEMAKNILGLARTEVGTVIPRSLSEEKGYVYVTLVN